jgi:hypothetical protein
MTNLLIVAGVLAVITIAAYLMFNYQDKNQSTETPTYTQEELDNIKLAEELYNKDLRPIVASKAKPVVAEELNVVEPEFIAKESNPEFPIDKPKKKRKYYPKKKKQ